MGQPREVVFVDGVRTAFGKAGPDGRFWRTRAADTAVELGAAVLWESLHHRGR